MAEWQVTKMKRLIVVMWYSPESSIQDKFGLYHVSSKTPGRLQHEDGMMQVGVLEDDC